MGTISLINFMGPKRQTHSYCVPNGFFVLLLLLQQSRQTNGQSKPKLITKQPTTQVCIFNALLLLCCQYEIHDQKPSLDLSSCWQGYMTLYTVVHWIQEGGVFPKSQCKKTRLWYAPVSWKWPTCTSNYHNKDMPCACTFRLFFILIIHFTLFWFFVSFHVHVTLLF